MRPRHTTAIALAASLACHACLMALAVCFGGFTAVSTDRREPVTVFEPVPSRDALGRREGLGEAAADFDALEALQATLEAQDQPLLGLAEHGPLRPGAPAPAQLLAAAEARPAMPSTTSWSELSAALRAGMDSRPQAQSAPASPSAEAPPRQAVAATDPGPPADREVDLFSKEASADYRAGRSVAREGREFKIRGLRAGLSAFLETAFIPRPIRVSYRIHLDDEGHPLTIEVQRSSGNDVVDREIRKDLFNSWFDPDPAGDGSDLGKPFLFSLRIE